MYKKYKKEFGYSYTLGVFPTLELLKRKSEQIKEIILSSRAGENEGVKKIRETAGRIPVEIDDKQIAVLTPAENCYAIGVFTKYESCLEAGNHLLLVNPDDAGNLGTIMRTALGLGINNIGILTPAVDIFEPRTIRAAMGAIFAVNWELFSSFEDYRAKYANSVYPFMTEGKTDIVLTKFVSPWTLVFGNEGTGLPPQFLDYGQSVRIRQTEEVDSLNLSVAAAIGMYQALLK